MKKYKWISLVVGSLSGLVIALSLFFAFTGNDDAFVGTYLYLIYFLVLAIAGAALAFGFSLLIKNKEALIRVGGGMTALLTLFFATYKMSSSDVSVLKLTVVTTPGEVQFVGGLTTTTFVLIVLGAAVLLFFEVKNKIKNGI